MLQSILAVGIGGFLGSIVRYLITHYVTLNAQSSFPFGTITVNLVGSFLIGAIIAMALGNDLSRNMRMLLATGFCGGFTTFSTFSYEFFALLEKGYHGYAFLYVATSLILGLAFVWLGFYLIK
ncbi:fluoride efflux transporter CrcB [Fodinibius sp. Rm-B-1B1-1]|uniref:fluoride efflux transporter CrcB n=1 Tax=Fodinibius alkaliphilus TaxID=3140241 RepID=UPI00315A34E9